MKHKKPDFLIGRYQLEHLVPLALTIISAYFWFNFFQSNLLGYAGLTFNLIGLIIWWSAKLTLAENWDAGYGKPKIKKLVTLGIYSKIRHPLYSGIILTLIGLAFMYPKVWFILVNLLIVVYFIRRMRVEDRYLTETLGKRYRDYQRRTWI
jgi:protein-S-isoprenylcysteine O-methyltransferase Ste14